MINFNIKDYILNFQKPNILFLLISLLYFLNNSIFSINENFSIFFYLILFFIVGSVDFKIHLYKINLKKTNFIFLLLLILPGAFFIFCRYIIGISFKGDEIAHFSNSITNLSYWFTPQNFDGGLNNYVNQSKFLFKDLVNIKIINLFILSLVNILIYKFKKKFFNIALFLSSLMLIFFQKSFPYEYSQGSFFIDNFTQIFSYLLFPFLFSETLGLTNFILFVIYLIILRPLLIDEVITIKDLKIFILIFLFPTLNLLLFSNYQEGIAVLFVLLAVECFYKFKDFKKTAILFSLAGCFREVFFLPIIILFIFNIIKEKSLKTNIKFYFIIFTPFIFHLLHISKTHYGKEKIDFIYKLDNFMSFNFDFTADIILKLLLIIVTILFSYLLFKKKKEDKFIILALLNLPILIILLYRNNFSFIQIDRFYYLWILIFYFYFFVFFSNFKFSKYFIAIILSVAILNNYVFFKKFINYEYISSNNKHLYLPIKKHLLKSIGNHNLIMNSDLEINKFNNKLYPNLKDISFNNGKDSVFFCRCDGQTINVILLSNDNKNRNFCKISLEECNKTYTYKNKFYSFNIFK